MYMRSAVFSLRDGKFSLASGMCARLIYAYIYSILCDVCMYAPPCVYKSSRVESPCCLLLKRVFLHYLVVKSCSIICSLNLTPNNQSLYIWLLCSSQSVSSEVAFLTLTTLSRSLYLIPQQSRLFSNQSSQR
jgi:hypothetical protein